MECYVPFWPQTLASIAQIIIAAAVAYVAWQNYKINKDTFYVNKDKIRLDLFDRRYIVFEAFKNFFLAFIGPAKIESKNLSEFINLTSSADFLFGEEIVKYREEVINNSRKLKQIHYRFDRSELNETDRKKFAEEAEKLEEWLAHQNANLGKIFKKYLNFQYFLNNQNR